VFFTNTALILPSGKEIVYVPFLLSLFTSSPSRMHNFTTELPLDKFAFPPCCY